MAPLGQTAARQRFAQHSLNARRAASRTCIGETYSEFTACSMGRAYGSGLALSNRLSIKRRLTVSSYLVTIEFDDGARAITEYSSPADVRTKLAEVVRDLTDEDGIEHFRSVTVTQSMAVTRAA